MRWGGSLAIGPKSNVRRRVVVGKARRHTRVGERYDERAKEALIKSVRGEPVEPRTDNSSAIYGISRSSGSIALTAGFDKRVLNEPFGLRQAQTERRPEGLRKNGRLNQCFPACVRTVRRNRPSSRNQVGDESARILIGHVFAFARSPQLPRLRES
jgi:hypothetical protein